MYRPPPNSRARLGSELRTARIERGLTIEALALQSIPANMRGDILVNIRGQIIEGTEIGSIVPLRHELAQLIRFLGLNQEASDRWYLLAGMIPDDLADMLLAKPERAADVRRVLSAEPTVEAYPTPPITEPV